MEFSGRLAAFPVGDILQWAQNDRRSGALVVRRSGTEKRVYLRDGDIVACYSDDPAEYFGQYLLVRGLLTEAQLIQALTYCQKRGGLLGKVLVALDLVRADEMAAALRDHVEDLVCELFLWKTGIFYFTTESVADDQRLPAPLSAAAVALEGSRRADEHQRIRRLFVHDNVVLVRGKSRAKAPSALAERILESVDGERTLAELYSEVRGSWYRFLESSYRLAVEGVLDIGEVHDPADTHSTELRLADLLIEQLAEEQSVFLKQHFAIPYDALESFVPVWVRAPGDAEEARASGAVREFYEQIDGRRSLAELVGGGDRDERARRMDRLVLQLREGALALLPAPAEELAAAAEEQGRTEPARWWRRLRDAASR
jgi:hypothetical protein